MNYESPLVLRIRKIQKDFGQLVLQLLKILFLVKQCLHIVFWGEALEKF